MHAVIDFDDVILDFHSAFMSYGKDIMSIDMEMEKHTTYDFYKLYGLTTKEFLSHIITDEFINRCEVYQHAKESIDAIIEYGCKPIIVTARSFMPDAASYVQKILDKNQIRFEDIIISGDGIKKSYYYQKVGNIEMIVDDAFHNIQDAYDSKIVNNIYLVNKPWNSLYNHRNCNATRVSCIKNAIEIQKNK